LSSKKLILVTLVAIMVLGIGAYSFYPLSLEHVVSSERDLYVLYTIYDVEDGKPVSETGEYVFGKESEELSKIREILGRYTYHRGLRILSWDNDLGISGEGSFIQLISGSNALSSGGTGEIMLSSRIYSVDYWGKSNNRALLKEIIDVLE